MKNDNFQIDQSELRRTRSAENVNLPPQIIINQVNTVIITIIIVIKIPIMIIDNIIT